MKTTLPLMILAVAMFSGCTTAPAPEYNWYHPEGGEYLFAFDASECESEVLAGGRQLGTATDGPFFRCMEQRGYLLVTRALRTVATSPIGEADVSLNGR